MSNYNNERLIELEARLAEAEDAIERAGRCLAMSNKGAAEALAILMVYKQADSASAQLAAAGYTKRDTRLQCDECGKWFTPQLLPAHKCAADQPEPVK